MSLYNILTLNNISQNGLKSFPENFSYGDDIINPDGIVLRSYSLHDFKFDSKTIAIARAGSGVNNVPIKKCSDDGIVVFNTPGANANAVKELVLAALFLSSRKILDGANWVKSLANTETALSELVEKNKKQFAGPEISGKKLGVIGLGSIGSLVAISASKLGMKVFGFDPYMSRIKRMSLEGRITVKTSLESFVSECDYITLHVPLTDKTRNLVQSSLISKMKDQVRILNFSRAELINVPDLLDALNSQKVLCYATDWPSKDLIDHKNVISLPHLGASTPEAEENCAFMAVEQLSDYLQNGNIKNSVNFPDMYMSPSGQSRLCVLHHNVPDVINNISHFLSKSQINIENMQSHSKGDYAYAVFDLNCSVSEKTMSILEKFKNIIKIRTIDIL